MPCTWIRPGRPSTCFREEVRPYFIAPLLAEASVHTNTSGVFKGFYKDRHGVGKFGGTAGNALSRILGDISLPFPRVFPV